MIGRNDRGDAEGRVLLKPALRLMFDNQWLGKTRVDRLMSSTHPDGDERLHPFAKSKTD